MIIIAFIEMFPKFYLFEQLLVCYIGISCMNHFKLHVKPALFKQVTSFTELHRIYFCLCIDHALILF